MTAATFTKATKRQSRLRLALIGPSGSGKTYSALRIAKGLGGKTAMIDTERGSASKYADLFDFDTLELGSFSPQTYVEAIELAGELGYDNLIIDSLSHAWMGKDGALEQVDRIGKRIGSGNNFAAWREVTPMHNALVDAVLTAPMHVIGTMRSKTEYVQEKDERGKTTIRKVGLAPVQRDGLEYEFDVVGDLSLDNELIVTKTRCSALTNALIPQPGEDLAETLKQWLGTGEPLANEKQQTKLSKLITDLSAADPSRAWTEVAEKYAVREFQHGTAHLTISEAEKTIAEFGDYLKKVKDNGGKAADEPNFAQMAEEAQAKAKATK